MSHIQFAAALTRDITGYDFERNETYRPEPEDLDGTADKVEAVIQKIRDALDELPSGTNREVSTAFGDQTTERLITEARAGVLDAVSDELETVVKLLRDPQT